MIGTLFAERFRLDRVVGQGGMAIVYAAYDRETSQDVAVKIAAKDTPNASARFLREIQALALLHHPHIIALLTSGETATHHYFVMPLLSGQSVRLLVPPALSIPLAVRATLQIAQALAHCHAAGVVHRDIKPHNLLVQTTDPLHLYLSDFGIARIMDQGHLTAEGTAIGTPEYIAPEQVKGDEVDGRADLYGLGCVLYELLTGQKPFLIDGMNDGVGHPIAYAYQHLHAPFPDVWDLNPRVPVDLRQLIASMTQKEKEKRISTAAQVIYQLTPLLSSDRPSGSLPAKGSLTVRSLIDPALIDPPSRPLPPSEPLVTPRFVRQRRGDEQPIPRSVPLSGPLTPTHTPAPEPVAPVETIPVSFPMSGTPRASSRFLVWLVLAIGETGVLFWLIRGLLHR